MIANLRFPTTERLKSRKIIDTLFGEGRAYFTYPLRVHILSDNLLDIAPLQVVFAVPKRKFRKAVDRNLIRRRMREAWRLTRQPLIEQLISEQIALRIMLTYTGKVEDISYARIFAATNKIITRCISELKPEAE